MAYHPEPIARIPPHWTKPLPHQPDLLNFKNFLRHKIDQLKIKGHVRLPELLRLYRSVKSEINIRKAIAKAQKKERKYLKQHDQEI